MAKYVLLGVILLSAYFICTVKTVPVISGQDVFARAQFQGT